MAKIGMEMSPYNPFDVEDIMLSEEGNIEDVSISVESLIVTGSTFSTEKKKLKKY